LRSQSAKNKKTEVPVAAPQKPEVTIKEYSKITKEAISDQELFIVHKVYKKYFFEIPNVLLNKDMLLVSRLSKSHLILEVAT
jgi:hypothetical protein